MNQAQLRKQIEDARRRLTQENNNLRQFNAEFNKLCKAQNKTRSINKKFLENQEKKVKQISRLLNVSNGGQMVEQIFKSLKNDLCGSKSQAAIAGIKEADIKLTSLINQTNDKINNSRSKINSLEFEINRLKRQLDAQIAAEGKGQ